MNTTYFLNCAAGNLFKTKTNPAIPAKYYIGLSTKAPNADGSNVSEPSASAAYARVELNCLGEPSNGIVKNTATINFAESTASWGTVTHFVVFDSPTGGNLLMYGALSTPRTVEAATMMTIKENALTLSVQNIS